MQLLRNNYSFAPTIGAHGRGFILLTALLVSASCSSSDDNKQPTAGSGGKSGAGGASGKAGSSAGTAGSAGGSAAVACGSNQCTVPPNPLAGLLSGFGGGGLPTTSVACCIDAAKGTCGTAAMSGATCEPPAVADPRCPGPDLGALGGLGAMFGVGGGAAMPGCCVDNACGLDGALLGRGCVENSAAKSALGALPGIGTLINVPPPLACDRPMDDAGAEDAGQ
jgi:hypothetical protein